MVVYRKACYSTFERLSDKKIYGRTALLKNLDDIFRQILVSSDLLFKLGDGLLNTRRGGSTETWALAR